MTLSGIAVAVALIGLWLILVGEQRSRAFKVVAARWRPDQAAGPPGFMKAPDEQVLFYGRCRCALPAVHTATYGIAAGFVAAGSTSRVGKGDFAPAELAITTKRVLVFCAGEVQDWPLASVAAVAAKATLSGSRVDLSVSNVGHVSAVFQNADAAAVRAAILSSREGAPIQWASPSLS